MPLKRGDAVVQVSRLEPGGSATHTAPCPLKFYGWASNGDVTDNPDVVARWHAAGRIVTEVFSLA